MRPAALFFATGKKRASVKLYDLASNGEPRSLLGHIGEAHAVAFSPDGNTLATGGADRTVRLWQVATVGNYSFSRPISQDPTRSQFFRDGCHLAGRHPIWTSVSTARLRKDGGRKMTAVGENARRVDPG